MVVALDLECAAPAVAHVDNAGVFARPLYHAIAFGGQTLEMDTARFVGAVLAPHDTVDAKLSEGRDASKRRQDAAVLVRGDAVLGEQLRAYRYRLGNNCRG